MKQVAVLLSVTSVLCAWSPQQQECLASRKILHSGQCYTLLQQGPCDANNRLILDVQELPNISAVCSQCKCCDVPRAVWWPRDNTCRRSGDDDELCPAGTYLDEDLFGEGDCLCKPGHARTSGTGPCHALYQRDACTSGQVLVIVDGNPRCMHDPCDSPNSAMAPDGRCYTLGSRGPCPGDSSFNVHPDTLRPQCIDRTNHIIQLPCMSKVADTAGGCRDAVQPEDDSSFGMALIRAAKNKRRNKSANQT